MCNCAPAQSEHRYTHGDDSESQSDIRTNRLLQLLIKCLLVQCVHLATADDDRHLLSTVASRVHAAVAAAVDSTIHCSRYKGGRSRYSSAMSLS